MINEHVANWLGYPVSLLTPEIAAAPIGDYANTIYRLAIEWDSESGIDALMERFTADPACAATPAIIIGSFHGDDPEFTSDTVVQLLVAARHRLPNLRGIFVGDIVSEENEISWINQSDVSPLFQAYPALEHFRVRGANGLSFGGGFSHRALKSLVVECGGLPRAVIAQLLASDLPALEHLELWLGDNYYGGDATDADLATIFDGSSWPKLKHLGLRDCPWADEVARGLLNAPVVARLEGLDLSLGALSDAGAEALLANPALRSLKSLDLHHHYLSEGMMAKVRAAFPRANLDEQQKGGEGERYIAVSE